MKSVLISIQPKWCEKICNKISELFGKPIYEKGVEIRKTKPNLKMPFKAFIYCTKPPRGRLHMYDAFGFGNNAYDYGGKVIGEFVCNAMFDIPYTLPFDSEDNCHSIHPSVLACSCLTLDEIDEYLGKKDGYGWHITDLVIYDEPKELSEFERACPDNVRSCAMCRHSGYSGMKCSKIIKAPQSWCYVEERSER